MNKGVFGTMKDRKIAFTMRVPASVLAELRLRAKQQCVPVQDLARFCLERSLIVTSLEEIRNELIHATQSLIAASRKDEPHHSSNMNGAPRAVWKSILFTEQYLRSISLKDPDPVSSADRISSKRLKEIDL
jgi:hypothetical protein